MCGEFVRAARSLGVGNGRSAESEGSHSYDRGSHVRRVRFTVGIYTIVSSTASAPDADRVLSGTAYGDD